MAKKKSKGNFFSVFAKIKSYLNMIYMLFLFPIGIISFVLLVTLLAVSIALISAPILAPFGPINFGPNLTINSLPLKLLISVVFLLIGIFLLTLSLYVFNGFCWLVRKILDIFDLK